MADSSLSLNYGQGHLVDLSFSPTLSVSSGPDANNFHDAVKDVKNALDQIMKQDHLTLDIGVDGADEHVSLVMEQLNRLYWALEEQPNIISDEDSGAKDKLIDSKDDVLSLSLVENVLQMQDRTSKIREGWSALSKSPVQMPFISHHRVQNSVI